MRRLRTTMPKLKAALKLVEDGQSIPKAAAALDIPYNTLWQYCQRDGVVSRARQDAEAKTAALKAEALRRYPTERPRVIAQKLGVSYSTVVHWASDAGVRSPFIGRRGRVA